MGWLQDRIDKRVDEKLHDAIDEYVLTTIRKLRKDPQLWMQVAEVNDSITLGRNSERDIVNVETDKPELIDGWIDLSGLEESDSVELEMSIRLPNGEFKVWGKQSIRGSDAPAFRISNLMAPAGILIRVKHLAGKSYEINWYLTRSCLG